MEKSIALEGARGIAALVVVAWHICLGFFPHLSGAFPEYQGQSFQGSPLFVFMNGPAAVALFFTLSGYVLTKRYFETGEARILLKGSVKRWPRLMGPVVIVVLTSYLLFKFGFYQFEQAGLISGSRWLAKFGSAYEVQPAFSFADALLQGLFLTFFRGDAYYDSAIWTMRPEFIGSFIAFGAAPILLEAKKSSTTLALCLIIIGAVLARYSNLFAFPIGVGIAALLPRSLRISAWLSVAALISSLYLLGYSGSLTGFYSLFPELLRSHAAEVQVLGAAILIAVLESSPMVLRSMSGRITKFLGNLSFPIYLVHTLVICSIGSSVYLSQGPILAAIAVFGVSLVVALPLMAFNRWWLKRVNQVADFVLSAPHDTKNTSALKIEASTVS